MQYKRDSIILSGNMSVELVDIANRVGVNIVCGFYEREKRPFPKDPLHIEVLALVATAKKYDLPLGNSINEFDKRNTGLVERLQDELSFLANPYPDEFLSILVQNGTAVPGSLDDRLFLLNFFKARCALKMGDPSVLGTFNDIYEESFFQRFSGEIELIRNNTVNPSENRVVPINAMAEPGESKSWSSWDS